MNDKAEKLDLTPAAEKGGASQAPSATADKAAQKPAKPVFLLFDKNQGITIEPEKGRFVRRKAEDGVMILDPSVPDDKAMLDHITQPGKMVEYRCKKVKSLSVDRADMTLAERLDELLSMTYSQRFALVPKPKQKTNMSDGAVIAAIIEKEV